MSDEYEKITATNEEYKRNKRRNIFLYHSYMGGEVYKKGEYLTKYTNESEPEYEERLDTTPLDNHCSGVVSLYNSFLFRTGVNRVYGSLESDPSISQFEKDADLEGRSLDAFMKEANVYASIFGMTWIVVSKPNIGAVTRADELAYQVRPYLSIVTPLMMLDWRYERNAVGHTELTYAKYVESETKDTQTIIEWYPELIITTTVDLNKAAVVSTETTVNNLGMIPVIAHYSQRSHKRGVGISLINDICDIQRAIYNEYSEIEQTVRLSNAASLVKTPDTEAGAGPGAIIHMPDGLDPNLKPYLLQPSGASVESLYASIREKVAAIDRIAHLGAMRETTARTMSGVSRQMEFEQLNSRLSELADSLELTEEGIMRVYAKYQGGVWDGAIEYPDSFNVRDANSDLDFYLTAMSAPVTSETYRKSVQKAIAKTVLGADAEEYQTIEAEIDEGFEPHVMISPTGERVQAQSHTEHLSLMAAGYVHLDEYEADEAEEINLNGNS